MAMVKETSYHIEQERVRRVDGKRHQQGTGKDQRGPEQLYIDHDSSFDEKDSAV
jgi:hypothetical protein